MQAAVQGINPTTYNIVLTDGNEDVSFDLPPALAPDIVQLGYVLPVDDRCEPGLITRETHLHTRLAPVLGSTFQGTLGYQTRKQTIVAIHDTAILAYTRQDIIDPRLSNKVATLWDVYIDSRFFPKAREPEWLELMGQLISMELAQPDADSALAEIIKQKLLEACRERE